MNNLKDNLPKTGCWYPKAKGDWNKAPQWYVNLCWHLGHYGYVYFLVLVCAIILTIWTH